MALQTKTIYGTTDNAGWTFKMEIVENSINEDNLTSNVTMRLYIGRASGYSTSYFGDDITKNYSCGGLTYSETNSYYETNITPGSYRLIGSHTFNVSNTGSPTTINVSATATAPLMTPHSCSASGTMTLTEIIQGIFRIYKNSEWKKATPYLRVSGAWKKYIRNNGSWKKGV